MMRKLLSTMTISAIFLAALPSLPAFAQEQEFSGEGSLKIMQSNPDNSVIGTWTLIRPGNNRLEVVKKKEYETSSAASGKYTLLVEPPSGATTEVDVYINGELEQENKSPQAAFAINNGDTVLIEITYTIANFGAVSVSSDPNGINFVITGPDGWRKRGVTPESFTNSPIGLYSVAYEPPEECGTPRPKSDQLVKDGRVNFDINIVCDAMDELRKEEYEKQLNFVTVMINGKDVVFEDVPMNQWFSQYVFQAAKVGVMAGYTKDGEPTGKFGPSDAINMAQLAKIAIELTGIKTSDYRGRPANVQTHGQWFEQYFLVAEQLGWQAFRSANLNPGKEATRAEVVTTLLQALDVNRIWPRADMFSDVTFNTRYAASIETAASAGLVSGYTDENGIATGRFGPDNGVNRAEMAKIVSAAIDLYLTDTNEIQGTSR